MKDEFVARYRRCHGVLMAMSLQKSPDMELLAHYDGLIVHLAITLLVHETSSYVR